MQSLQDKIQSARSLLTRLALRHGARGVAVAFTGGKDSTVALHLWRETLLELGLKERPLAISLDTGLKFPEITAFRDELAANWDVDLRLVHPKHPPKIENTPWLDPMTCCQALKVEPLRRIMTELAAQGLRVLVSGLRADEHPSRQGRLLDRRRDPVHLRVAPLLDFTEMDIWSYLSSRGLPWCSLYDAGYRSLGCTPCTSLGIGQTERDGRNQDKEAMLGSLSALGYF